MIYLIVILLLLPSLTFGVLPGISTMPWAILLLPLYINRVAVDFVKASYVILFITVLYYFFYTYNALSTIQSMAALLNATIVIPYILTMKKKETDIVIKLMVLFCFGSVIVGLLQLFSGEVRFITEILFGRASGFGFKGVPSLSYEPSRAAIDMFAVLMAIVYAKRKGIVEINKYLIISIFVFLIIFNRSLTALFFVTLYTGVFLIKNGNLKVYAYTFVVLLIISISTFFFLEKYMGIHAIRSVFQILESEDKLALVHSLSGHRSTGILTALTSISFFGYGFGNWEPVVTQFLMDNYETVSQISYYKQVGVRASQPMTFFGRFIIEIGVVGVTVYFATLLYNHLHLQRFLKFMTETEPLVIIITLFVLSYGGNPVPFIALAWMYKVSNRKMVIPLKSSTE